MRPTTTQQTGVTVPTAAKLFGIDRHSLENWIRAGLVPVVDTGRKRPANRSVELPGLLTTGLVAAVAYRGHASYEFVRPACEHLASMSIDDIHAAIDGGRTWLVSAGDAMESRLIVPGTPIRNRTGETQTLFIFDLAATVEKIERALAARNETKNG